MFDKNRKEILPVFDKRDLFIFFGNHKVGLTSIIKTALADRAITWKNSKSKYYDLLDSVTKKYVRRAFKFTIVRNPFSRTVSAFFYLRQVEGFNKHQTFKQFIKNDFRKYGPAIQNHFHPMYIQAQRSDFVGKMENIKKDWRHIADKIDCKIKQLPKKNTSKHKRYSSYYDKECVDIVSDIYRKDLEVLGYKFEGDI